jgi:uncharacterized protein (DUF2336 family)
MATPSFSQLGPDGARLAYLESHALIDHLTRVHGERSLRDFVREIVRTGDIDRAARRTFRADLRGIESRFFGELLGEGR